MTFDPKSFEVTCVTLPKDHCNQVPWKYIKVCGNSDLFFKNLNQRSLTPRWPLTPHFLRSHVWLYPRIIVPKSHENSSKYVDTVTHFWKTWTKGHWPLTPRLLRSHVWLYPRIIVSKSHGNTSIYVDTVINFAKKYHILHKHTTYRMSDHIVSFWTQCRRVSFWTQFRRDKKWFTAQQVMSISLTHTNPLVFLLFNQLFSTSYWKKKSPYFV